ncbi:MAG: glycosyltransferase family 4 protein [Methanomassiliicoccales archaeon]|nr:MAG: glycosyltransferase family 4 protein [Methanomassiliicoccales archaeon]
MQSENGRKKRQDIVMAKKIKVLFIYPSLSSFIERDLNILKEEFEVISYQSKGKKNLFKLLKLVLKTDINISWFSLGYATSAVLFSKFFGKKSVVITGGWDVVYMPEIGYGAMRGSRIRKTRFALKRATKILAVSKSTKNWTLKWVKRDDVIPMYLGFDSEKFAPKGTKENMVLTVGQLKNEVTIRVKGLDTFVKTAELLPDVKFVLIGDHDPKLAEKWRSKAPPNLEIKDFQPEEKLMEYYQKAKVYAQLSFQESFGSALAEAMLCGCVPVVTKRGGMPEVVGDAGLYVEYGDAEQTAKTIKEALLSTLGQEARKRIATHFTLTSRKEKLIRIINECMK